MGKAADKAKRHVQDILDGSARWVVRIPAQPDNDSDCIILDGIKELEEKVERLQELEWLRISRLGQLPETVRKACAEAEAQRDRLVEVLREVVIQESVDVACAALSELETPTCTE